MSSANAFNMWRVRTSLLLVTILFLMPIGPLFNSNNEVDNIGENNAKLVLGSELWDPLNQPWAQYSRLPTHNGTMPPHGPNGGPGSGSVSDVVEFGIIDNPTVNWVAFDDIDGADAYGSIIGNFSSSITASAASTERCGEGELFGVLISSDNGASKLSIITGDDAKVAWEVDLGQTETIRSTPMLTDINQDSKPEILLVYDTETSLEVEAWSPELSCSESGWVKSGHDNEKLWSMSNSDYSIGINSPHLWTSQTDHKAVTQPLLADLDLDGDAELVIAAVDRNSDDPTVVSLSLSTSTPTEFDWEVVLDRGTHPSDPAWGMLDDDTTAIVLTTIDSNSGNMWIWRIDGASGSLDWERVAIGGTDSDSDAPRLRLPGPVVVQLDADNAPEMILTIPTDSNGRTSGNGARFVAMEMTSTDEIFEFRAPNGYSDSQPLPIDTDGDLIHDRLCWITWYSESSITTNRKGMAGCHDITQDPPSKEWSKDMQRGSGTDNDEIGVSPPIWMDINGDAKPELIVPFGKRLWAFDGDSGTSAEVSDGWSSPLSMPHRVWSAPAVADMDNDGTLDILIGDTLISQNVADFAPLSDNRGISFNPSKPDPGDLVTVTGQFSNIGTLENQDDLDVAIIQNGNEIARQRFTDVEPVAPTGNGGPYTFSVDITAELGIHTFELILDINGNLSEAREDNNNMTMELVVVEPYVAQIDIPNDVPRIAPGTTEIVSISLLSTGSRTEDWTFTWDDSNLPDGWSISSATNQSNKPTLEPGTAQQFNFVVTIPQTALGDDNSYVTLSITLDIDNSVTFDTILPLEVLRTRGLSIVGPSGLDNTTGFGRPGNIATAWMMVENLGNAYETTTSTDWTAPSWGGTPKLHDKTGSEVFSLNLAPGEMIELFVNLNTPQEFEFPLGSTTTTTMTMCIGSGAETLCEDLTVNLTSALVTIQPIHQRTLPNETLSWSVEGAIPSDGMLSWNIASANMIHTNWAWSVDGDLSFTGSNIEANGLDGDYFSGNIYLDLPVNALPQRHYFSTNSSSDPHHNLFFTLHVLQVYRSAATILQPVPDEVGQPIPLFVEVSNQILLRLENPGNGEDEFILETQVINGPNMTSPPIVEFTTYNPQKTLGALASTIATVDVLLSEDTPALEQFTLRFSWTSLGNPNASTIVDLLVEAEPDHSWSVDFPAGLNHSILPKETITLDYNVKNTGNAIDDVIIKPVFQLTYFGQDNSIWSAQNMSYQNVSINQTVAMTLSFTAPSDTWSGTSVKLTLEIYSNELLVNTENLSFNVQQISGWRLNLSDTNLVIDPNGQNLTLNVQHLGNLARQPWYTKASEGWNITVPQNGQSVNPYGSSTVTIFVNPPSDAIAGDVGILRLRVSDGDGSGQTIQEIPVRVGTSPNIVVDSKGSWAINDQDGGMPTAWVNNMGNDIAVVDITFSGTPNDWSATFDNSMVVSPGQIIGIPINLMPDSSWDGTPITVTIGITHPITGLNEIEMLVVKSNFTFTTSPVISGVVGNFANVGISNSLIDDYPNYVSIDNNLLTFSIPNGVQNISIANSSDELDYFIHSAGYQLPDYSASCDFTPGSMDQLGMDSLTGQIATCTLSSSLSERFTGTIIVSTSMGELVNLKENRFLISANQSEIISINTSSWKPDAGILEITLKIIDSYGREIESKSLEAISRSSGWNVGINEITADDDIMILITRTSYERLADVTCTLKVESTEHSWEKILIIDIESYTNAPTIKIDNPGILQKDDVVNAELRCSSPYDIDDNPSDDTAQTFYKPPKSEIIESSEILFGVITTGIILMLAYFSGFIGTAKIQSKKPTKKANKHVKQEIDQTSIVENKEIKEIEETDDISLEPSVIEEEIIEIDEQQEIIDKPIIDLDDATASGRLASLRNEIMDDERPPDNRPLADRMSDFFKE